MPVCSFNINFTGSATDLVARAQNAIEAANGTFSGDEQQGSFSVPVPGGGQIKGTYTVAMQTISFAITQKPFYVSCNRIENELRRYINGEQLHFIQLANIKMAPMKDIKTISQLQSAMISSPDLQEAFKEDPVGAIKNLGEAVPDTWIYRVVVGSLGLAIILVIIAVVILSLAGKAAEPTILTAIASGAIGALAGLLAPQPK